MRMSVLGAGRVAHHLAKVLAKQHQVIDVYSRRLSSAQQLAQQVGANAITQVQALNPEIDLAIIAVSDQAIQSVISEVAPYLKDVLIVHTSGSTHLDVLSHIHPRAGVFYPLQTFSFESQIDWANTPLFIEAKHEQDQAQLLALADQISQRVYAYNSEQRLSLHLAAVFACNFSNSCFAMAKQVLDAQQVDFSLLYPLMRETTHKATQHDPKQVQTGPAIRGDQHILNMHQQMLMGAKREDLQQVYALMSQQIQQQQ
ncbi:Rossmann-like and DUF2520 domain-containing protein [Acinetobacter sp. B51(2017)]|uniref:Rossmann-like and DUF2520 domain-containing protein n=1 Tax=Acinetobacter sp. B51(2017) TaxID=2060938 RepID=UPI000F07D770|nr:Rossmann-like and DUF2520 domain-containing protein [Acinetobacter sp. B51(2017)]